MANENSNDIVSKLDTQKELERIKTMFYIEALELFECKEFVEFTTLMNLYIYLKNNNMNFSNENIDLLAEKLKEIFGVKFTISLDQM